MLSTALRELRYHPGRYMATLIAVAIAIGFMSAASVVTATESTAMTRQGLLPYGKADLVVEIKYPKDISQQLSNAQTDDLVSAVTAVSGVSVVTPVYTASAAMQGPSGSAKLNLTGALPEQLRGNALQSGSWPTGSREIAISSATAKELGVTVGATLKSALDNNEWTVTGITNDPKSLFGAAAYVINSYFVADLQAGDSVYTTYAVKLDNTSASSATATKSAVNAAIDKVDDTLNPHIDTFDEFFAAASKTITGNVDALKYVLWVFAAIAVVVGMITIANTFTILLAGRRRQIGLLRAIGADGSQIRRSVLMEAMFVGLAGAAVAIGLAVALASAVGLYTGSIHWGVTLPWRDLALAVGMGLIMTVAAAFLPSARSTAIAPMEALRPVDSVVFQRRVSTFRALTCLLLLAAGGALVWVSFQVGNIALPIALLAASLITFGVLFAAPLFVPALMRIVGAVVGRFGMVPRLAVANSLRNPARSAATASALMLAVGLVFTLQIGSASMRETVLDKIAATMPIDIAVTAAPSRGLVSVPEAAKAKLEKVDGVSQAAALSCSKVDVSVSGHTEETSICGYSSAAASAVASGPQTIPAGELWVPVRSKDFPEGSQVSLTGASGQSITLTAHESYLADNDRWFVSPEAVAQLGAVVNGAMVLLRVPDHSQALDVYNGLASIISEFDLAASGGLMGSAQLEQILQIVTSVLTGLLAVAVLVALVGVGNTLTLSVIERTRESALLRALGLQRRSLKAMLAVEALLVVVVGAAVGLAAGVFFGWLGTNAMTQTVSADVSLTAAFAVDWKLTLGLLGVLAAAALLASLIPGQRAAKANV
ncbi:MAG: FtsX-like permease family protein, partial [Propionibacteriaceae bacterium]|nr:FtsX-like permease family protein [Propionibacteriaceae bacterium]